MMRSGFISRHRIAWILGAGCAALLPVLAQAQPKRECALKKVELVDGPTAYGERPYGCEGFFVQQQANLNVQVLSLRQGPLPIKAADALLIAVPRKLPDSLATSVAVYGVGLTSGLNWALDGPISPASPMRWLVSAVVRKANLPDSSIGLLARALSTVRFATPWYVAVRVAESPAALDAVANSASPTELVVRIPAASRMQCRTHAGDVWAPATLQDGDGRFKCTVPATHHGALELQLQWSPRGIVRWSDIETLRLWLW